MQQSDNMDQVALAAARQHMGEFAVPTVIFAGAVIAAYTATVALTLAGMLPLAGAVPAVAVLTYLSYTILHEAAHGNISGSNPSLRRVNDALGYMAGWILMIPLTVHRHEHLAHHRNTNDPDGDPDFVMSKFLDSPLDLVRTAPRVFWKQYGFYLASRWGRGPKSQDVTLCLEIIAMLVPRVAVLAAGFAVEGVSLFLFAWLIGVSMVIYLFAYVVHRPHESVGRYVDTSTILVEGALGKVVTWLWVYQNYHSIHHLFPRVPFYRYAGLFAEIEQIMSARGSPIYRLDARGLQVRGGVAA